MTNDTDAQYLSILQDLLDRGVYREGRNGGTYGLFGAQMRFDLREGFPLLTTKRVFWKAIAVELLWFLRGDTNVEYLHEHGVTIWDEWADAEGDLGPVYGKQWRSWPRVKCERVNVDREGWGSFEEDRVTVNESIDQLQRVLDGIRIDPYGRRHIVSAWNPAEIDEMALPPCHCLFQFHVAEGRLSCHLYQRSADWFLGVPFNIASYALLTHLVAREVGLQPGDFVHSFGDLHLYANHIDQARDQLNREPRQLPLLSIDRAVPFFDYKPGDISVVGYDPLPAIKAEVAR